MEMNRVAHVVVDMLYDFIDGSLACLNSEEAVDKSVQFINDNPNQKVLYIADAHPANHCSFKEQGGIWPPHCVAGAKGGEIHQSFYQKIEEESNRPSGSNTLKKGEDPNQEQYSGYEASSSDGLVLKEYLDKNGIKEVFISGIATEYCIKATALDLVEAGFKVNLIEDALAYVDAEGHRTTLPFLEEKGVKII